MTYCQYLVGPLPIEALREGSIEQQANLETEQANSHRPGTGRRLCRRAYTRARLYGERQPPTDLVNAVDPDQPEGASRRQFAALAVAERYLRQIYHPGLGG